MTDPIKKAIEDNRKYIEGSLQEYFDNLKSIKGETFTEVVRYLSGVSHAAKLISIGTRRAPEHVRGPVGMQFAAVSAGGATLIFKLANFSEDDIAEAMQWCEKISDTVDVGMERIHDSIEKHQKGDSDD